MSTPPDKLPTPPPHGPAAPPTTADTLGRYAVPSTLTLALLWALWQIQTQVAALPPRELIADVAVLKSQVEYLKAHCVFKPGASPHD